MIQLSNALRIGCLCFSAVAFAGSANVSPVSVVEDVLKNEFPKQPNALARTTQSLLQEYKQTGNVASLVFYSYGLLRQAHYFLSVNDIIHASEYSKTGFFYLDEAVDSNENDFRVRYLRARVDAYLPAELGRCVITIEDTDLLLKDKEKFSRILMTHIYDMRYRALQSCKEDARAKQLVTQMKTEEPQITISRSAGTSPSWDIDEVTTIILPLVKGN